MGGAGLRVPPGVEVPERGGRDGPEVGSLNPVMTDDDWKRFPEPFVIDSGAAATVLPMDWFKNYPTRPSDGSKRGQWWHAANGGRIFNLGEKKLHLLSVDGDVSRTMNFQVADVGKALGSVAKIVQNGTRIVFDPAGSYIERLVDGKRLWMREAGGVYVLDMWVAPNDNRQQQPFRGRERRHS